MSNPILEGIRTGATLVNDSKRVNQEEWRGLVAANQFDRAHKLDRDKFREVKRIQKRGEDLQLGQATYAKAYELNRQAREALDGTPQGKARFNELRRERNRVISRGMRNNSEFRKWLKAVGVRAGSPASVTTSVDGAGHFTDVMDVEAHGDTTDAQGNPVAKGDPGNIIGGIGNDGKPTTLTRGRVPGGEAQFISEYDMDAIFGDDSNDYWKSQSVALGQQHDLIDEETGKLQQTASDRTTGIQAQLTDARAQLAGLGDRPQDSTPQTPLVPQTDSAKVPAQEPSLANPFERTPKDKSQTAVDNLEKDVLKYKESQTTMAGAKGSTFDDRMQISRNTVSKIKQMARVDKDRALPHAREQLAYLKDQIIGLEATQNNGEKDFNKATVWRNLNNQMRDMMEIVGDETLAAKDETMTGDSTGNKPLPPSAADTWDKQKALLDKTIKRLETRLAGSKKADKERYEAAKNNVAAMMKMGVKFDPGNLMDFINFGDPNALDRERNSALYQASMARASVANKRLLADVDKSRRKAVEDRFKPFQAAFQSRAKGGDYDPIMADFAQDMNSSGLMESQFFTGSTLGKVWDIYQKMRGPYGERMPINVANAANRHVASGSLPMPDDWKEVDKEFIDNLNMLTQQEQMIHSQYSMLPRDVVSFAYANNLGANKGDPQAALEATFDYLDNYVSAYSQQQSLADVQ